MLSIRMQRLGRKGHPVYRIVVQDSRQSPDSGKYVALLGNYDPHTKTTNLSKDKAEHFLKHGAQPSDRVIRLFESEKISLPGWVKQPTKQERKIRNLEKLRRNRPADAPAPEKPSSEQASEEETLADQGGESTDIDQAPVERTEPAEEVASEQPEAEAPAEEPSDSEEGAGSDENNPEAQATDQTDKNQPQTAELDAGEEKTS